jgi:hypothetical protein
MVCAEAAPRPANPRETEVRKPVYVTAHGRGATKRGKPVNLYIRDADLVKVRALGHSRRAKGACYTGVPPPEESNLWNFRISMEELLYGVALWPALIVKTLVRFTLRPERIRAYVADELQKRPEGRYNEFVSPVVFWLLCGTGSVFLILEVFCGFRHHDDVTNRMALFYLRAPIGYRFLEFAIFALTYTLAYALDTLMLDSQKISRAALRRPLYIQFLALTPFFMAGVIFAIFATRYFAYTIRWGDPKPCLHNVSTGGVLGIIAIAIRWRRCTWRRRFLNVK